MKPKYLFEFILLKVFVFILNSLPMRLALQMGEMLGLLLAFVLPKRKRLILSNLASSFPMLEPLELRKIAHQTWRNLGRNAVEFACLPKLSDENVDRLISWKGVENVERALALGRGVVLVAAHFSSWEMTGWATQYRFKKLMAIARPMKNPLVEKWVQDRRTEGGNKIALHREAVRASLKWLKLKNIVGILSDQNLYTGGVFVDFFGRPAATTTLPTLLHERTGCPVIFTYTLREGNKFVVHYDKPFEFKDSGDSNKNLHAGTQLISDHLEKLIRKYPENWFWIHNRWKRQP